MRKFDKAKKDSIKKWLEIKNDLDYIRSKFEMWCGFCIGYKHIDSECPAVKLCSECWDEEEGEEPIRLYEQIRDSIDNLDVQIIKMISEIKDLKETKE